MVPLNACLLTLKALATRCQSLAAEVAVADAAHQEILDSYAPMPASGSPLELRTLIPVCY
jgi:hypothetical protein